jgi:hypothetical protein
VNPGLVKAALGLVEKLIRPLMLALGLWKVKQVGRQEAIAEHEKANLENANEAISDRLEAERDARSADDDELARMLLGSDDATTPRNRD